MNFSKPSILILFVVLISVGVGTASALVTITLAGNTIVQGTLTADNYFDNGNTQTGVDASALGGIGNTASGEDSTVGGGTDNTAGGDESTIGGGGDNIANAFSSTVGGGAANQASGIESTVGGGEANTASGPQSTIGGGLSNTASGQGSTIGGGDFNRASGFESTIPGGRSNEASGDHSFATGSNAKAIHDGAFVWADDSINAVFSSTADNQFSVRAAGGTRIFSNADLTTGVVLAPGTSAWAAASDYRLKDNISEYSVLDKLDDYRAVEFDWKAGGNHDVGVMAQELESIFPELVNTGSSEGDITNAADPGVWSVQYSKLGALALQAIKEQQTIIDSLISIICEDHPDKEICLEN